MLSSATRHPNTNSQRRLQRLPARYLPRPSRIRRIRIVAGRSLVCLRWRVRFTFLRLSNNRNSCQCRRMGMALRADKACTINLNLSRRVGQVVVGTSPRSINIDGCARYTLSTAVSLLRSVPCSVQYLLFVVLSFCCNCQSSKYCTSFPCCTIV